MFQVDPIAVYGLVTVAISWALAVVLFRTGAEGKASRRLALLLVVEGFVLVSTGILDFLLPVEARSGSAYERFMLIEMVIHTIADTTFLALYPPFLSAALGTPLVSPFDRPALRWILAVVAAALVPGVLLSPEMVGATALYLALAALFWFAFVASIQAWRKAPAGAGRTRAGTLALAFGIRDLCWGYTYAMAIGMAIAGTAADQAAFPRYLYIVYISGTLFAIPVIAYGILRTQLFDIDLRLRWTIKQSTLAGAFVAILYLVTEGAQRLLSSELGTLAGLLAAAVLLFFLSPLQRLAESVASKAMPNTQDTPEYAAFRKLQVYEAALMDANRDGGITGKERALLDRLRDSLGIEHADASALERDLAGGGP